MSDGEASVIILYDDTYKTQEISVDQIIKNINAPKLLYLFLYNHLLGNGSALFLSMQNNVSKETIKSTGNNYRTQ